MATTTDNLGGMLLEQASASAEAVTNRMPTVWVEKTETCTPTCGTSALAISFCT